MFGRPEGVPPRWHVLYLARRGARFYEAACPELVGTPENSTLVLNNMPKILIADPIAQEGVELLRLRSQVDVKTGLKINELVRAVGRYDALVVRSETKVTAEVIEAGKRLQVIA